MAVNETALHKLASVISDVDNGVNTAISWVDEYSEWLAWGAVLLIVVFLFSCFICPLFKCGFCMYMYGSKVFCCCCRRANYFRQDDDEC